ncbi:hypothetical protein P8C59_006476 [Phyllachora maydis]|uniref:Secreted protein n=1 Tax=Phyllachora maydis TaxID=1825666 RepID=A0AAD9I7K2_9PEZI|nr:hypothetical protein P8C59_006476 [Phyllachora maydis]
MLVAIAALVLIVPRRSKRTAGGNAGRYTTNSGLIADKDDNNAYNRAYMPPTNAEEEEEEKGSSSNNDGVNGGTSDSADKGEGSSVRKRSKSALYCEAPLARPVPISCPIMARYLEVLIAFEPASAWYKD